MTPAENQRHDQLPIPIPAQLHLTASGLAILAYVRRLVPTRADADDVMQEVMSSSSSVARWTTKSCAPCSKPATPIDN